MSDAPPQLMMERRLDIVMFSGDVVRFRGNEFLRAVVHRYMLVHYMLIALVISLMGVRSGDYVVSDVEKMQIVFASLAAAVFGIVLVPGLGPMILRRRGGVLRLPFSPVQFVATVMGVVAGQIALMLITGESPRNLWTLVVMTLFYYLFCEAVCHYVMLLVVPRMLRDMRGGAGSAVGAEDAADDDLVGVIVIRGERIPVGEICGIRADGNYIHVRTRDRLFFLPGPFGGVIQALPCDLGMRVSRSDWVARAAVSGVQRSGRDVTLELVDGSVVRVAQAKGRAVLDWLEAEGQGFVDAGRGSEMSTQTG